MVHVSGNADWTNTVSTPVTATALENVEQQLDYVRPWLNTAWLPTDHGLLTWNYDPILTTSGTVANLGVNAFFSYAIKVGYSATATGLVYHVISAGSGPTANSNALGLYAPPSYNLVASTADLGSTWTSTGIKTTPFTSTVTVNPGIYAIGLISAWSTTNPTFQAVNANSVTLSYNRSP